MCTADFEKLWVANLRVSLKKAAQTLFVFCPKRKLNYVYYLIIMGLLVWLGIGWVDTI